MKLIHSIKQHSLKLSIVLLVISVLSLNFCSGSSGLYFKPVNGFTAQTNKVLESFFEKYQNYNGRKVAVFDGDGTVMGQCPHYLADECLYTEANKYPNKKPKVISRMVKWSNVSTPYVQHRVFFFEGDTLEYVRNLGDACFKEHYKNKIFKPMKELILLLKRNGFEVWIITASPEFMYQKFLSRELKIPITSIIGVKAAISGGKITSAIVNPVPQDHGKKQAIETFVQEQPLLVAGNSRGDKEMIEYSKGIKMIINPDEHVAPDQKESIADYARKNNWFVVKIRDIPESGFPAISSKVYKIRKNKARPLK